MCVYTRVFETLLLDLGEPKLKRGKKRTANRAQEKKEGKGRWWGDHYVGS